MMKPAAWLQDRRMHKFLDVLGRWEASRLSQADAAEILGMSERTFRRYCRRYDDEGEDGLMDRRLGKTSSRRVPPDTVAWMQKLYRTQYYGWNAKHFHEALVEHHNFRWGYTWTKTQLHAAGLLPARRKRGAHRLKRERKPCEGMMLHQDGSRHEWLQGQPPLDLIVTMDDATSRIYSAFLVAEEGTASTFRAFLAVFRDRGLPCALYTDRGSHYFLTAAAGGKVDRTRPTQVGRALAQLGIEHIAAYSPQARGRSERAFGTLQERLVKELAAAGINDVEAANRFIAETYLPRHNQRFAVVASDPARAFVPLADPAVLDDILCHQTERQAGHDNTVRYRGLVLPLPSVAGRAHFARARMRVHAYPHGGLAVFHGPRKVARYTADGELIEPAPATKPSEQAA